MRIDEILSLAGRKKPRRRAGRGKSAGRGKTCGRGHKGAGQRAGRKARFGYEGGQNPALSRIPQRGFNNANFRTAYQVVNVSALGIFDDCDRVDPQALAARSLIRPSAGPVKILGDGKLSKKLTVIAHSFSSSAAESIEAVGGSIQRL